MSDLPRPIPLRPRPSEAEDRLDSWKEIAAYLGREVRTVQGWEKNEGLPVHRHQHARQGSVYAFKSELDAWREARKGVPEVSTMPAPPQPSPSGQATRIAIYTLGALVVLAVAGFAWWKTRAARAHNEPISSIVVLPFLDLSPQKDQDYFSDGLTEEIIDALSRVPNLHVVARTTAFAFKGKASDIRQIGQQLNVSAVLEGSVRKAGDQLRITAQLNRVSDGYHLWSRTFNRQLRDVFAVQQEISQSIADEMRAGEVPQRAATRDVAAYELFQEGRYFFNKHEGPDTYTKAIERYQKAIDKDPNFALAYAGMADSFAYLAENAGMAPKEVMPKAKAAAEKAVALDDNLAEAHTSLGIVKLDYERDREGGQREFQRAMQLNPGSGYVRHWYAHSLEAQGRLDEAMKEMRAAFALDPLSLVIYWDIGEELLCANQIDNAIHHLDKGNELFPNYPLLAWERMAAYCLKGDLKSGRRVLDELRAAMPGITEEPPFMSAFAAMGAREGKRAEARQTLDRLEELRKTRYVEPAFLLQLCAALGDHDRLRLWMQRAHDGRSSLYVYLPIAKYLYDSDPAVIEYLAKNR